MQQKFVQTLKKVNHVVKTRKTKGEINYFLAIAIGTVILVVVGWPQLKAITTSLWTTVSTWFTANSAKVFTNLP